MKTLGNFYTLLIVLLLVLTTSCTDDSAEPCDEDNVGTIILENKGVDGSLQLYVNPVRIGSNTPGDLSVQPGEKASIDVPAGSHNILVRSFKSECSGNRCFIQSTPLDEKSIDVSACQNLNMAY